MITIKADVVVLDYRTATVHFVQLPESVKNGDDSIEAFLDESLDFDMSNCYWMSADNAGSIYVDGATRDELL